MMRARSIVQLVFMVTLTLVVASVSAQEGMTAPEAEIDTAPVQVDGQTLFRVRGASSLSAQARAHNIADRIESVAADVHIPIDTVRGIAHDGAMRLMARDRLLMVVTDADARLEQLTPAELATFHLDKIRQAITDYRQARSPVALRRDLSYAAAATLMLLLTIALCLWLARRLDRVLEQHGHTRIHALGIQSWEIPHSIGLSGGQRGLSC
jgi:hypothetical protein